MKIPPARAPFLLKSAFACGLLPGAAAGGLVGAWAWLGDPEILRQGLRVMLAGVPLTAAGALALLGFIVLNLKHPTYKADWRPRIRAAAALLCLNYPLVGAYAWGIGRLQKGIKVVVVNQSSATLLGMTLLEGGRASFRLEDLEPGGTTSRLFFPQGSGPLRLTINTSTRETQCVVWDRPDPERGGLRKVVVDADINCSVGD